MKRTIEYTPLELVAGDPENPKDHDLGELQKSVARFGFADAPIIDERTGRLVGGHGRVATLRAMKTAGLPPPEGVEVDDTGSWSIPMQRGWASKSDRDARAYTVALNRIPELGGWDAAKLEPYLLEIAKDGEAALQGIGYDAGDVDKILRDLANPGGDEPEPEAPQEIYVKPGDVWALDNHRLRCGDSLVPAELGELLGYRHDDHPSSEPCEQHRSIIPVDAVISDPPYAIFGSSTGIGADVADDKMVVPFFESVGRACVASLKVFGHVYLFNDWRSWPALKMGVTRGGLSLKNCIAWDKGGGGVGSMWANCYELIGFFTRDPAAKAVKANQTTGQRMVFKPNILRHNRPTGEERPHNAAKPVKLIDELIEASTDRGDSVLDMFLGGGSTLIACELAGRQFFGQDLEPKWVQCAIERWQKTTGRKAQRVKSGSEPGKEG